MSDEEESAALGRLVKQRSDVKRRKALLENDLRTAGDSLVNIGSVLRHISGGPYDRIADSLLLTQQAPSVCGLERVRAMLTELTELHSRLAQLNRAASDSGID